METYFYCGPIEIHLIAPTEFWRARAAAVLDLYKHWREAHPPIHIELVANQAPAAMTGGNFLRTASVNVDKTSNGLRATCVSGAWACSDELLRQWKIFMPAGIERRTAEDTLFDDNLEYLLELILTTAWRQVGAIALHAGAVTQDDCTAILTAPSRGGKTTLTAAMLHRGWKTLGDDKLLIYTPRSEPERILNEQSEPKAQMGRGVRAYSLETRLNLDPQTRKWFSEIGDITAMPLSSAWTAKRRVPIESIWQERLVTDAPPTHLVQIQRYPERRPTRVQPLARTEVLGTLLQQTVIPTEPAAAGQIVSTIAALAKQVRGLRLELGEDAYAEARTLDVLMHALHDRVQ